jgi:RNA-binding protein
MNSYLSFSKSIYFRVEISFKSLGSKMQKVGKVLHSRPRGLVVQLATMPRLGVEVMNKEGERIGKVLDIIGPVKGPYALVRPFQTAPSSLVDKNLYLEEKPHARKRKGKKVPSMRKY